MSKTAERRQEHPRTRPQGHPVGQAARSARRHRGDPAAEHRRRRRPGRLLHAGRHRRRALPGGLRVHPAADPTPEAAASPPNPYGSGEAPPPSCHTPGVRGVEPGVDASSWPIWSDGHHGKHHSSPIRVRMAARGGRTGVGPAAADDGGKAHMAPYESDDSTTAAEADDLRAARRRKAARYVVPVTVVGVAAATIGLVPALADSGDPDLPKITAQELIEKIAASDVQQLSGTVKISTDLGLPDLGGLESGLASGAGGGLGRRLAPPTREPSSPSSRPARTPCASRPTAPTSRSCPCWRTRAEYSLIHNGKDVWGYDSKSNEVFHAHRRGRDATGGRRSRDVPATPKDLAEEALKAVDDTTSVTVDGTAQVAGRDAYRLVIKPKDVRVHGRPDHRGRGREDRPAAEVHADPGERRRGRRRRRLHQGQLRQAGRLDLRLHPAQGREGHRGRGRREGARPRLARTSEGPGAEAPRRTSARASTA